MIQSNMLASYNELASSFKLRRVNHSLHFVDPRTGTTTNRVESFWGRLKRHLRRVNGSQGESAMDHVQEAVYRQNYQVYSHTPWDVKLRLYLSHLVEYFNAAQSGAVPPFGVIDEEEDETVITRIHRGQGSQDIGGRRTVRPSTYRRRSPPGASLTWQSPPRNNRRSPSRVPPSRQPPPSNNVRSPSRSLVPVYSLASTHLLSPPRTPAFERAPASMQRISPFVTPASQQPPTSMQRMTPFRTPVRSESPTSIHLTSPPLTPVPRPSSSGNNRGNPTRAPASIPSNTLGFRGPLTRSRSRMRSDLASTDSRVTPSRRARNQQI